MTVIQSWKQNLKMLQPQNIKNLGLLSLKLIKDNIFVLSIILFGYIATKFLFKLALFFVLESTNIGVAYYSYILSNFSLVVSPFIYFLFIIACVVSLRSSMKQKDRAYFISLIVPMFFLPFVFMMLNFFIGSMVRWTTVLHHYNLIGEINFYLRLLLISFFYIAVSVPVVLFFFDQERRSYIVGLIKSIYSGYKFFLYNLPVCLMVIVCFGCIKYIFGLIVSLLIIVRSDFRLVGSDFRFLFQSILLLRSLLFRILDLFKISFIITIYNALIYEQRSLYFND